MQYTTNFNLNKPDLPDRFSKNHQNTNMDTIDAKMKALESADEHTDGITKKVMTADERAKLAGIEALAEVNNISDTNATDLTDGNETALHKHTASNINVVDNGNYFTGTQVESVLQEVGENLGTVETQLAENAKQYGNRYVRGLGLRLKTLKKHSCILLIGDSTGVSDSRWFKRLADWLAPTHKNITFELRRWSDTYQNYSGEISYLQTGSDGDAYIKMNGSTSFLTLADSAGLRVTGDLDVSVKFALDDWGSANKIIFASKSGQAAGRNGWAFGMHGATKKLYLQWSPDGTSVLGGEGSAYISSDPVPAVNAEAIWLRVKFDVNNGSGGFTLTYYTSTDGTTWEQLGDAIIDSFTTSIYASTTYMFIGCTEGENYIPASKFYKAIVRSGIDGKIIASPNAGYALEAATFTDTESNLWTIANATEKYGSPLCILLNGSFSGAAIAYSLDDARLSKQAPIDTQIAFVSYGHNEISSSGFETNLKSLFDKLIIKYPYIGVVGITQNPQKAPRLSVEIGRQSNIAVKNTWTTMLYNYGSVDSYGAFMDTGNYENYINSDGVHPNEQGDIIWFEAAKDFMLASQ